jgi:outer membrane protein OmpA-like peptidoglycan-associated protein
MGHFFRVRSRSGMVACLTLVLMLLLSGVVSADDCRRVSNILVLFDASGFMKQKGRYEFLIQQMNFFVRAMPLTRDGFFNVGLRNYGLKVGMGCENTESILAVRPWDPERFINSFPKFVSYGVSSLTAGIRAAADEVASLQGKSIILVIGGGLESCKTDPIQATEQICANNPDVEIHTFQIGNDMDGRYWLAGIAQKGRGTYTSTEGFNSSAPWYAWMKRTLVVQCQTAAPAPAASAPAQTLAPVTFDSNSSSVRSKNPQADAANRAALAAVAQNLNANPALRVVLHGFSDGKGSPEVNLKVSQNRAEAVAHYLISTFKIAPTRITVTPHGMAQSLLPQPVAADDRMARRVEFELRP